ncbi:hypothetical protein ACFLUC_01750 [Chloroflexota bacterium]
MISKASLKRALGDLPLTAEVYWSLRQKGQPLSKSFSLHRLEEHLPEWCTQVESCLKEHQTERHKVSSRRILVFTTLRYWIEHATILSLALIGQGHEVTFVYLPYANWQKELNRFDLRRQNAYAGKVFKLASPVLKTISLLDVKESTQNLPASLESAIKDVSLRDAQYTLQIENVDREGDQTESAQLYNLRLERNMNAARQVLSWILSLEPEQRPEVIITPNGSILEMGAIYQVAHHLNIPTVTYEFGEQRGRIWLANNAEVMRQETDAMWETLGDIPLTDDQWHRIRTLYDSRQNADLWNNFSRLWQDLPSQGGLETRKKLGLDSRPIVLLAANVIGDSLTLGRQVFSKNMTEWLERTIHSFAQRPDVQFVIRVHPGERYTQGPSIADIVRSTLPATLDHIHLIEAGDPINTYDLIEIANLGLVYTTTVGMEMAMSGVPVLVAGQTHYSQKGFTLDVFNWEDYFITLEKVLGSPDTLRLSQRQVELAWRYAYRFYFDYPCPFPWHLLDIWEELETWPIERVLSNEGQAQFGDAFRYLAGAPRNWDTNLQMDHHVEKERLSALENLMDVIQ